MSVVPYNGGYDDYDNSQALALARYNSLRDEFNRQLQQVQTERRELSDGRATLQRDQLLLTSERSLVASERNGLTILRQELTSERAQLESERRNLDIQRAEDARREQQRQQKEALRRARRRPSEVFLEDKYPSLDTAGVVNLLSDPSDKIRKEASTLIFQCATTKSRTSEPAIDHHTLMHIFLSTTLLNLEKRPFPDVLDLVRLMLRTPAVMVDMIHADNLSQIVSLFCAQPWPLSQHASIGLQAILDQKTKSSELVRRELVRRVHDITADEGISLLCSTSETVIPELLTAGAWTSILELLFHKYRRVRAVFALEVKHAILPKQLFTSKSPTKRPVDQVTSVLAFMTDNWVDGRPRGHAGIPGDLICRGIVAQGFMEKLVPFLAIAPVPEDILEMVDVYLLRCIEAFCLQSDDITALLSLTRHPMSRVVRAACTALGFAVRQIPGARRPIVDCGALSLMIAMLGTPAPDSMNDFSCTVIANTAQEIVAAGQLGLLVTLMELTDPATNTGPDPTINARLREHTLKAFRRITPSHIGQLAALLQPFFFAPPPFLIPVIEIVLPAACKEIMSVVQVLSYTRSPTPEVRNAVGSVLVERCHLHHAACETCAAMLPEVLTLCASQDANSVKIGGQLLEIPGMGACIVRATPTHVASLFRAFPLFTSQLRSQTYIALLDAVRSGKREREVLGQQGILPWVIDHIVAYHTEDREALNFLETMMDKMALTLMTSLEAMDLLLGLLAIPRKPVHEIAQTALNKILIQPPKDRTPLRVALLTRIGKNEHPICVFAGRAITEYIGKDLLSIPDCEALSKIMSHPEGRLRTTILSVLASRIKSDEGLPQILMSNGFFSYLSPLLQYPTPEVLRFFASHARTLIQSAISNGELPNVFFLLKDAPDTQVRQAAALGISHAASHLPNDERVILVNGLPSSGHLNFVAPLAPILDGDDVEDHVVQLCRTMFPQIALRIANTTELIIMIDWLSHRLQPISAAAALGLDRICASNIDTRTPLRRVLYNRLESASPPERQYTAKAFHEYFARDLVVLRDLSTVFHIMESPHNDLRLTMSAEVLKSLRADQTYRILLSKPFWGAYQRQMERIDPVAPTDVRAFFVEALGLLGLELGHQGATKQIIGLLRNPDDLEVSSAMNALLTIAMHGSQEDRTSLVVEGLLDVLLIGLERDEHPSHLTTFLHHIVPPLGESILMASSVQSFLFVLANHHSTDIQEVAISTLNTLVRKDEVTRTRLRREIWTHVPQASDRICEFVAFALDQYWFVDMCNKREYSGLFPLLGHPNIQIRSVIVQRLKRLIVTPAVRDDLVSCGIFEAVLGFLELNPHSDLRSFITSSLLPQLGIALGRGGKIARLQLLISSAEEDVVLASCSAISAIAMSNEPDRTILLRSKIVPTLVSNPILHIHVLELLNLLLERMSLALLLNGDGDVLFQVLDNGPDECRDTAARSIVTLSKSDFESRDVLWALLSPRLTNPSENLCRVAADALVKLSADRTERGDFQSLYNLLGHTNVLIRRVITKEVQDILEGAEATRSLIVLDLMDKLLDLSSTDGFPDIIHFTGDIFLPSMAPTISQRGGLPSLITSLSHNHRELRHGACSALVTIGDQTQGPKALISAGLLPVLCNTARFSADEQEVNALCRLMPRLIELLQHEREVTHIFAQLRHPHPRAKEAASQSLMSMCNQHQAPLLLHVLIRGLQELQDSEKDLVTQAIRILGGDGVFARNEKTTVLLELFASEDEDLLKSAQDAVVKLVQRGNKPDLTDLVTAGIDQTLLQLARQPTRRDNTLNCASQFVPSLVEHLMSAQLGSSVLALHSLPHSNLRRGLKRRWRDMSRTETGVSLLVRERIIRELLNSLRSAMDASIVSLISDLAQPCAILLLQSGEGDILLELMRHNNTVLLKAGVLAALSASTASEEARGLLLILPEFLACIRDVLDTTHDPEVQKNSVKIVRELAKDSPSRSAKILSSPVHFSILDNMGNDRDILLHVLKVIRDMHMALLDKRALMQDDLVNKFGEILGMQQDADVHKLALEILSSAAQHDVCRTILATTALVQPLLIWIRPDRLPVCRNLAWSVITSIASGTDDDREVLIQAGILTLLTPMVRDASAETAQSAIKVVSAIGQTGSFRDELIQSGVMKKLEHIVSPMHKSKLAPSEDKAGTKLAATLALKHIKSVKRRPQYNQARTQSEAFPTTRSPPILGRSLTTGMRATAIQSGVHDHQYAESNSLSAASRTQTIHTRSLSLPVDRMSRNLLTPPRPLSSVHGVRTSTTPPSYHTGAAAPEYTLVEEELDDNELPL